MPLPALTALYTTTQIRALEQLTMQQLSAGDLMQRAGQAAFQHLCKCWPKARQLRVFCGNGNNGGDGYVVATLAKAQGLKVEVRHLGELNKLPQPAAAAMQACHAAGVTIQAFDPQESFTADVIVDALLGIGLNRDVDSCYTEAIAAINSHGAPVLAVDIPSGIAADSGQVCGNAVHADYTITFIGVKQGLVTGQAPAYCGQIELATLDIPSTVLCAVPPAATTLPIPLLPARRRDAHKGDFGHVLVIGGNYGMGGAAQLAATAALRSGAGLVSVATRAEHVPALLAARPEIMAHGVTAVADLEPLLARANVIVLGAGLGQDAWAKQLYQAALASNLPTVIDADGLNLLAQQPLKRSHWVLTPHPGEAARLLQTTTQDIQKNRYLAAQQLQQRFDGVVVLKGAGSIVQGNQTRVCTAGNPGMASGGMGDVLGGIIGGLIAQGIELETATASGVALHAMAADRAALAGERGLLASDVIKALRGLVN